MDEYFCPHCGAVLNYQDGFDPDEPWTCTVCGSMLYGDAFPEGDRFPGVVWKCDSCGAVLNTQFGFDDNEDYWVCTECGHHNSLSGDDVYTSEAEYEAARVVRDFFGSIFSGIAEDASEAMADSDDDGNGFGSDDCDSNNEDFCPCCGTRLNDQYGYDHDKPWTCTHCDTELYQGDYFEEYLYPGEVWRCESCNAVLNTQPDFDEYRGEWTCTKCGHVNTTSGHGSGSASFGWPFGRSSSSPESSTAGRGGFSPTVNEPEPEKVPLAERFARLRKNVMPFLVILLIALLAYIGYKTWRWITTAMPIGISSEEAKGQNYRDVVNYLEGQGFTHVQAWALADLSYDEIDRAGQVLRVTVFGSESFDADTRFTPDSRIEVYYHSADEVGTPLSARDARGMDYQRVVSQFEEAGFGNITVVKKADLVIGVIGKPNTVASISIDGEDRFDENDYFAVDSEVIIEYHVYMWE